MTAPTVSSLRIPGTPTWDLDAGALRIVNGNCRDELGRRWTVDKHPDGETGWAPSAAPRTQRTDRPSGHGSFRSVAWRKGRSVTLQGAVECGTPALREQTETELAGLCSDPGRLYTYRRTTETFDQSIEVELDDAPQIAATTITALAWQFSFYAPDPRKHAWAWQLPQSTVPASSSGGLDFSGSGLSFAAPGLSFGTSPSPEVARVKNEGTAPARPLFTLTGPLTQPVIRHLESGRELAYLDSIAAGETVSINCDDFSALGVPDHGRISSTRGNVGALVPVGTEWPVVDPSTAASFQLWATGASGAGLRTALRSAWW